MNGHVALEVVMPGELLAADGALIRLLLSVRHHVRLQRLILREEGSAHVAVELPGGEGEKERKKERKK